LETREKLVKIETKIIFIYFFHYEKCNANQGKLEKCRAKDIKKEKKLLKK